jgi:hypothetical protein
VREMIDDNRAGSTPSNAEVVRVLMDKYLAQQRTSV